MPMLPVENCDNVFQTVYGLLPGYHQVSLWVISFFFFWYFEAMPCGI